MSCGKKYSVQFKKSFVQVPVQERNKKDLKVDDDESIMLHYQYRNPR